MAGSHTATWLHQSTTTVSAAATAAMTDAGGLPDAVLPTACASRIRTRLRTGPTRGHEVGLRTRGVTVAPADEMSCARRGRNDEPSHVTVRTERPGATGIRSLGTGAASRRCRTALACQASRRAWCGSVSYTHLRAHETDSYL